MLLDPSAAAAAADDLFATVHALGSSPTPIELRLPGEFGVEMPDVGAVLLNRWRVVAWAGLGGANTVFRGEHIELDWPVAIKVVNCHYPLDRNTAARHLRNEARILARWRHPNLPRLWDFHEGGQFPLLVTDFFEGATLRQMIGLEGRLSPGRAVRAAMHVVEALAVVWRDGIVHRDVKPENILLAADGTAKLLDFGLATTRGDASPGNDAVVPPRVGTVAYLAPEQARNSAAVDLRADIYSLGATLYHAVTGRLPFSGADAAQVILRHIEDEPVPPIQVVPDLNSGLSDLVMRMMAKNPAERFANASELLAALTRVQNEIVSA
jgi:serine/threonine protein kinase